MQYYLNNFSNRFKIKPIQSLRFETYRRAFCINRPSNLQAHSFRKYKSSDAIYIYIYVHKSKNHQNEWESNCELVATKYTLITLEEPELLMLRSCSLISLFAIDISYIEYGRVLTLSFSLFLLVFLARTLCFLFAVVFSVVFAHYLLLFIVSIYKNNNFTALLTLL